MKNLITCILLLLSSLIYAHKIPIDSLKKQIIYYNQHEDYELSIQSLSHYLSEKNLTSEEKFTAYLLKSTIYKKLFKYEHALHHLNLALKEAEKDSKLQSRLQEVKAEKSFVFFDMQQFDKAKEVMRDLKKNDYAGLTKKQQLFLKTQEGYFFLMDKNYKASEEKLNEALKIAEVYHPEELPIVYGKFIELYHFTKQTDKRDAIYNKALLIAKKLGNIKYEFYLHEIMKRVFSTNKDYEKAVYYQKKCDSVYAVYNANNVGSKIEILEQQLKDKEYHLELEKKQKIQILLLSIAIILFLVVFILIQLYRSNKQKNALIVEENQRFSEKIDHLTELANKAGDHKIDLNSFNFTERQLEIIDLVQKGKNNKEIAAALFISENTVKYHLKAIYTILNIKQRNELMILYRTKNELPPDSEH
ncbi:helix-turn-helix domain-containing protein [Paenimyroides aestuarii]|uniref:Helix-turn-helix transcriptional regulator n=1 Tax=Paenimyroides aestuarii TaxID=2968490 RepID=A0ABY5NUN4_9FLAO|nr:helix-turn-helix transcriptional regulator [Paenimyroides aestuarii]UUV22271.1 helix-turn-helix transcriptional regulator [Paenimyroides aestuarii]